MLNAIRNTMSSTAKSSQETFIGSIDQGTTSTRFLIFNRAGVPVAGHQIEFKQFYPQPGYAWKLHRDD
jgi:glycerol kinase